MRHDGKFVILVTAGRKIRDPEPIRRVLAQYVLNYGPHNIKLRQGCAVGGDSYATFLARALGITDIEDFPVRDEDWLRYGKAAGNIRNEVMLDADPVPDIVLAFPDNESKGTYNCFDQACKREIPAIMYFDYLSSDNPKRIKYHFYGRET